MHCFRKIRRVFRCIRIIDELNRTVERSEQSSAPERQGGLAALGLCESKVQVSTMSADFLAARNLLMHPNIWRDGDICLRAWGDQNELPTNGPPGGSHLARLLASDFHLVTRQRTPTSMSMAIFRLTWSMYTSLLAQVSGHKAQQEGFFQTYNSSRQRIGDPMASQRANKRQT